MARGGKPISSRGRGKFKVARGGGRHFSRELDPRRAEKNPEDSSDEEEEDDEDEDDGIHARSDSATAQLAPEMATLNLKLGNTEDLTKEQPEMTRAERKAILKAKADAEAKMKPAKLEEEESEDEDDELLNPWKATEKRQAEKAKIKTVPTVPRQEMSRRDKEAADKKAAQERYQQLHAQGKTVEAKTDLARLQEVRRRREAAAAQREAEAAEAAKEAAAKKSSLKKP